jgi:outer membrane lipoprotein-sorting protein
LLPAALDFSIHPDNNAVIDFATEVRFSEYRAVSGVAVPFHVQKYVNNGLVLDLQFANAAVNSGLPASAFQFQ